MVTQPTLIVAVLGALLAISEILPFTPLKSNGVIQGLVNLMKSAFTAMGGKTE